jgi:hypothetical protein
MIHSKNLSDLLPELEEEILKTGKTVRPIGPRSHLSKKRAYTLLLLENYNEVVLILRRILTTLIKVAGLQKLLFPSQSAETYLSESEKQILIKEQFNLTASLPVDVKSLYLWTAQITDIFDKSGVYIDLSELQRISLFRHNFITHIHETMFFETSLSTKAGTKFHPGHEEVEILYHPFFFSKRRFVGLKSIIKRAVPYIPELAIEENIWEQLYTLYRQMNKITDRDIQRSAKKIIFKLGNATESPVIIAAALLIALKTYRRA